MSTREETDRAFNAVWEFLKLSGEESREEYYKWIMRFGWGVRKKVFSMHDCRSTRSIRELLDGFADGGERRANLYQFILAFF